MLSYPFLTVFSVPALVATAAASYPKATPWGLKAFTSLVTFGDSYTDESRLGYFGTHNGEAPPVGWVDPVSNSTANGGYSWARYVSWYTGAKLYNYAVSGAVCSNDLTPRTWSTINAPFPAVEQYEVPAYINDSKYVEPNGSKFLDIPADKTVYAMWDGTNDLGNNAFLTDSQVKGTTLVDYLDCIYNQLDRIYRNGGRYFVLMNVAPLQLAPLYGLPDKGGVGPNHFWPNKPGNLTEISYRMLEEVVTVNEVYRTRTPYAVKIVERYPGAHFAVYDINGLWTDIYNHPANYLNGTPPYNVTGFDQHCNFTGGNCVRSSNPDSFLWFDELHLSEQTARIIAQNFVNVIKGASKWAMYWS
ncbi:hypothetical protein LTR66_003320 [Elasticomyces elasticus]|nr:hypothetical protein LTR66_003320 [Elasticomyces elasticus]